MDAFCAALMPYAMTRPSCDQLRVRRPGSDTPQTATWHAPLAELFLGASKKFHIPAAKKGAIGLTMGKVSEKSCQLTKR